jgi:hypothetical protein
MLPFVAAWTRRLRFGYAFPLAFKHHFPFKLSDPAQHRQHQLAGRRLGVHAEIENPHGDTLTLQRLSVGLSAECKMGSVVFRRWLPGVSEPERKNLTFSFLPGAREESFSQRRLPPRRKWQRAGTPARRGAESEKGRESTRSPPLSPRVFAVGRERPF